MQNKIKCPECGTENSSYRLYCKNCGYYLRKKIANIDLWRTIWLLFYSPSEAFANIIFSEHKNFTIIFSFLIPVKLLLDAILALNIFHFRSFSPNNFHYQLILGIVTFATVTTLFSILIKFFGKLFKLNLRIKDFYSIIIFSFANLLFLLFILTPIEYALFGKYWLTFGISPYFIRPAAAYVLTGIEFIFLLVSFFNVMVGMIVYLNSKIWGIVAGIFFNLALIYTMVIFLKEGTLK